MKAILFMVTALLAVVGTYGIVKGNNKSVAIVELAVGILGILISLGVFPLETYDEDTDSSHNIENVCPGETDLAGCNTRLVRPSDSSWLDEYENKIVRSKYGIIIYLRYEPNAEAEYFYEVADGSTVTVLARENSMSLVKIMPGVVGWARTELLVDME